MGEEKKFWRNFFDPSKNKKIKGFMLATVLVILGHIDPQVWGFTYLIFVGGSEYTKYLQTLGKK